ncbi:uncharacterized protein LOC123564661 [Mercenaria mercenaria]|uniref:uncharacterized protein LOC123564661 n=1 Tax=Mercenaria mercenaria TaxID=6596 RepID=UPI00234F0658|nr:uncharacterized protein LOC123564661 [Mercenaria mercenaria]
MAFRRPELPHDKIYHLFVCYEKNSLNFVRTIVDNLEAEGITCCYSARDFRIGRSFIGSMYEAIRKSLYMLIVLSEEFKDSSYCLHETEEAFDMKMKGEYDVIPIRIEPCTIPECLQHLVYIDVDDKDTIHNKVIDAMTNKDLRIDFREDRNGEDIQIKLEMYKTNWLSFIRYRLVFTEKERAKIWGNKFEVPADLLQEIEDTVNGSSLMKYGYICTLPGCDEVVSIIFLCLLILLTVVFLILFIRASGMDVEYILLVVVVPSFFAGIYIATLRSFKKDNILVEDCVRSILRHSGCCWMSCGTSAKKTRSGQEWFSFSHRKQKKPYRLQT